MMGAVIRGGCTSNPSHPAAPSEGSMERSITVKEIIEATTDLNKIYVKIMINIKKLGYILVASDSEVD
tara:strand:- start:1 stop:204 length:204 start_codon:yes stop_codon:yes gene_type:complete